MARYWWGINYREAYNLFITTAFCSTTNRRGAAKPSSLARSRARLTRIKVGLQQKLFLGNLDAKRDWGFAGDYVEAMWMMLQHEEPDDFVVATGESYSVREFLDEAAVCLNLDWQKHVEIDPEVFPPHRS